MATHLGKWNWLQEQVTSNAEVRTGAGFGDSAPFDAAVDGTTCSALTSELHPLENMRNPGSSCMLRLLRFLTLRVDASKSRFPISQGIYNDMSTKKLKTDIHWTKEINRCIPEQILCRRFLLLIFFCCNGGGRGGGTDEALAMINTHVHTLSSVYRHDSATMMHSSRLVRLGWCHVLLWNSFAV